MRCDEMECRECKRHGRDNLIRCDDCGDHAWEWQAHYTEVLINDACDAEPYDLCDACY